MVFKAELIIVSCSHFKSKDKTKDYYLLKCLTPEFENTEYFNGYKDVTIFIDEIMYNSIIGGFKPLEKREFKATISGDKVKYSL